jgi:hypothetical protein
VIIDDPETGSDPIPEEDYEGYEGFYGDDDGFSPSDQSTIGQAESAQGRLTRFLQGCQIFLGTTYQNGRKYTK